MAQRNRFPTYQSKQKPHITLVRGPVVSSTKAINNEALPSVAFAYLSGYLMKFGYDCDIVDGIAEGLNQTWRHEKFRGYQCQGLRFFEIISLIPKHTQIIGVSAYFSGEWPVVRELIQNIRMSFPDALIVAGGEHTTALSEYTLRDCIDIDLCVRGEGEHTLLEIVKAYENGGDFALVKGVGYIDETDRYVEQDSVQRIGNVDSIPWPNWPVGYLEKFWREGKSYGSLTFRDMPLLASRGCPFQCTFCSNPNMWTTKYLLRSVDDVIREIKFYIKRYQITSVQFYDLTAITKKSWIVEFCNKLISEKVQIEWSIPTGTRSEVLDEEVLRLLKKTNCNYLVYAPESGSRDTLVKIKKRVNLDRLTGSNLLAHQIGLTTRSNLIIGFPHETRVHIFETLRYGLYMAWKGIDEVFIGIFNAYPGSEIFKQLYEKNEIYLNDEYFLSLSRLNSDYLTTKPLTYNKNISHLELIILRNVFLLANYLIGYLLYPSRILRTFRNVVLKSSQASTVLEHRLKDLRNRKNISRSSKWEKSDTDNLKPYLNP